MLRLAADENFNGDIVRGLRRRVPHVDIILIQDAGLSGADDPAVLEWAARERRVLLTTTLVRFAIERILVSRTMPGVFAASSRAPIGTIIDDLVLLVECSADDEWDGQVRYLPL